jgi:hypothetical protein
MDAMLLAQNVKGRTQTNFLEEPNEKQKKYGWSIDCRDSCSFTIDFCNSGSNCDYSADHKYKSDIRAAVCAGPSPKGGTNPEV